MDSTFHTSLRSLALAEYGNGTGVRGISNGDSLVSTTVTLTVAMDATKFSVGMVVDLVAASGGTGLSPTLRTATGTPRITGVNASAGTLTFASNFSTYFSDEVAGDYLLRAGDAASAGTASVFTGLGAWVEGGSSPAALFGVTRTVDPIKLAGHAIDCSTLGVEDSFAQATTQIAVYGGSPTHCYVHPIKYGVMLKTATSRIQYQRSQFKAAGLLFSSLEVEGVNGPIKVVPDMNCDYGTAFMVDQSKIKMKTAGKCPKIFDLDTLQKQRVYNADKYEWRIGGYGNFYVERPSSHARLTSFGATT
jgi:hypothetical protein